jgi:hypothetical protein
MGISVRVQEKEIYEIRASGLRIGRNSDCDIIVNHDLMSRYHALIKYENGNLLVSDLGSRNGTWINSELIKAPTPLLCGSEIYLAKVIKLEILDSGVQRIDKGKKLIMGNKWFFRKGNIEYGPLESTGLISLAKNGKITPDTLIKLDGTNDWLTADNVEDLFEEEEKLSPPPSPKPSPAPSASSITQTITGEIVVCPHCWDRFSIENMLFISRHTDLRGDTVLGQDEQLRFLPSRFTPDGHAIDANGIVCPDMACHKCHLRIPESVVDLKSMFFSVVGAPASGKSYFLTSMTWQARKILPSIFNYSFSDADVVINQVVNGYEQLLYLNSVETGIVALPKTELQGALYHQIKLDGMIINLPMPFIFKLQPTASHPEYAEKATVLTRNLILYDNAGEHFQPGADSVTNPATKHLVHSNGLIFLFDPSKDARMRKKCNPDDPQLKDTSKLVNQETLLSEMISRIRRYGGMRTTDKYKNPMVVVVAKYDMWQNLLIHNLKDEKCWLYDNEDLSYSLDYDKLINVSYHVREMLLEICPEIVTTSESFASKVYFVPVSSIGNPPEKDPISGIIGVRPEMVKPIWAEVPLLTLLGSLGYIPTKRGESRNDGIRIDKYKLLNDTVAFALPGTEERIQLPANYRGAWLYNIRHGKWFILPSKTEQNELRASSASDDFWK